MSGKYGGVVAKSVGGSDKKTIPIRCPKCHKLHLFMAQDFDGDTLKFKCKECGHEKNVWLSENQAQ